MTDKMRSFRIKMLRNAHLSTAIITFVALSAYFILFHIELMSQYSKSLTYIASSAAALVNAEEHNKLRANSDEESIEYKNIEGKLKVFKQSNPSIKYIFTMRKTNQKDKWEFVVDGDGDGLFHIGDLYDISKFEKVKKSYEIPVADTSFIKDDWGTFLAGYAPIKDKMGKTVGVVGVDFDSITIIKNEIKILLFALFIYLLVNGISAKYAKRIIGKSWEPVQQIIDGIEIMQKGDLNFRHSIKTNDEFEVIANKLNETAEMLINYSRLLEKDLNTVKEDKEKIFKVYRDVIYSVTQGKFNLINEQEKLELEKEFKHSREVKINQAEDVNKARQAVEGILKENNFSDIKIMYIILCVSEAATNAYKHANSGLVRLISSEEKVIIMISDQGKGMDFDKLPNMLFLNGFSTQISMGYGFSLIYKYSDRIFLNTSNEGTFLVMEFTEHESKDYGKTA